MCLLTRRFCPHCVLTVWFPHFSARFTETRAFYCQVYTNLHQINLHTQMSQKISQKSTPPILISLLSCYDKCQDSGNWNVLILQKAAKKQESAIFNTNLQSFDRFCWQSFARLECPIYFFTFLLIHFLKFY